MAGGLPRNHCLPLNLAMSELENLVHDWWSGFYRPVGLYADRDGVVQRGLRFAAQGLPELGHALQSAWLQRGHRQQWFLSFQAPLEYGARDRRVAQQRFHHLSQHTVLIQRRSSRGFAWPRRDQAGTIDA